MTNSFRILCLFLFMDNNDIVFIRHAESQLNIASHVFRENKGIDYNWNVLCTFPDFLSGVKYNPDFLDCSITEKGVKQCKKARIVADHIKPDIILVSPLERTLQTCHHIFGGRGIPIVAEPVLAEGFRSSCDISSDLAGKQERFPEVNFEKVLSEGDLWFIKNESLQNQAAYYKALQEAKPRDHQEAMKAILDLMASTMIYEHPINLRHRSKRIKQVLKQYRDKYRLIAVIAHYNTINFSVCRSFNELNEPEDCAQVDNCQIYYDRLEEMLKVE